MNKSFISGGNLFSTIEYIEAVSNGSAELWRFYLFQRDYFANEFIIEGDEDLEDMWEVLAGARCDFGMVVLTHSKAFDRFFISTPCEIQINQKHEILGGRGVIIDMGLQMSSANLKKQFEGNMYINYGKDNSILLKFNTFALPLFWIFEPIYDIMKLYLSANKTNAITSIAKKYKININNTLDDIKKWEIQEALDPSKPFLYQITSPSSILGNTEVGEGVKGLNTKANMTMPNLIEKMENKDSNLLEGWDAFHAHLNFYYSHIGRIENTEKKRERLIVGEQNNSNRNIELISYERKKYVEKFIKYYNKMFNRNATIKVIGELELETSGNLADTKKGAQNGKPKPNTNT